MAEFLQTGQIAYEADIDNIVNFMQGEKILSGGQVTAQASPNMSVRSALGTLQYAGTAAAFAAVDPIAVSAADTTNARVDLVEVDGTTGAVTIKTGTAAAVPRPPALTAGRLLLAYVTVAAAAVNIQTSNITERRILGPDATPAGTLAGRSTAVVAGVGGTYFATDDNGGTAYRSNGTTWVAMGAGVTGTGGAGFRIPNNNAYKVRDQSNSIDVAVVKLTAANQIEIGDAATSNVNLQMAGGSGGGQILAVAADSSKGSIRLPHGAAPTTPVNGDVWTTTAGLFVRINGVTVGPLT